MSLRAAPSRYVAGSRAGLIIGRERTFPLDQLHFDARTLPPAEAFDRWRIGVSDFALSLRDPTRPFDGISTVTALGGLLVSESDLPPVRFLRTREMVLADGHDLWSLSLVLSGGMRGDADGAPFAVGPGGIVLFSHTRPIDILTERGRTIVLAIPGGMLPGVDPAVVHGALPETAVARLLGAHLVSLCASLPGMTEKAALPVGRSLIALIEAACSDTVSVAARREQRLRRQVIDHVAAHLADPVGVDAICRTLAVSRSALYRALRKDGGLRPLVARLRLQEAHRRLGDPADSRTIQEIAASVGYPDRALFSRHFDAAFGYTAAAFRERMAVPALIPLDTDDIPRDFRRATDRMFQRAGAA